MKLKILVLNGPNLNLLGERDPEVYGALSLSEINRRLKVSADELDVSLKFFQSNSEGELIDLLHQHRKTVQGVVFNPGAYTHYSYAIRDAISAIQIPVVEVHLSDIKKREPFRRKSVLAPVCLDQISGLGWVSYLEGLKRLAAELRGKAGRRQGRKSKLLKALIAGVMGLFLGRESYAFNMDVIAGYGMPGAGVTGSGYIGGIGSQNLAYGIQFNAEASSRLSIQFGTLYSPRGFSVTNSGVTSIYSTQALMFPIMIRHKWFDLISIGVGGYFSHSFIQGSWDVIPSGVTTMNLDDSGVILSGDLRFKILPLVNLVLDARYLYGFQNLNASSAFTAYVRDLQVLVGLRFGK